MWRRRRKRPRRRTTICARPTAGTPSACCAKRPCPWLVLPNTLPRVPQLRPRDLCANRCVWRHPARAASHVLANLTPNRGRPTMDRRRGIGVGRPCQVDRPTMHNLTAPLPQGGGSRGGELCSQCGWPPDLTRAKLSPWGHGSGTRHEVIDRLARPPHRGRQSPSSGTVQKGRSRRGVETVQPRPDGDPPAYVNERWTYDSKHSMPQDVSGLCMGHSLWYNTSTSVAAFRGDRPVPPVTPRNAPLEEALKGAAAILQLARRAGCANVCVPQDGRRRERGTPQSMVVPLNL